MNINKFLKHYEYGVRHSGNEARIDLVKPKT